MIRELSDLGKRLREENSKEKIVHDALKDEPISIDLIIDENGSFICFDVIEKISRPAEAITAKKGKARLLLDKAEEVLGYNGDVKKHEWYIAKLEEYCALSVLQPVFEFYGKNKAKGIKKALSSFESDVPEKERKGNIAFRIQGKERLHERKQVYDAIISKYENSQHVSLTQSSKKCSICGTSDYPVEDIPHGMIKRMPSGQTAGCALISYNEPAFESYDLEGNMNSSVCSNCARTYVEALNWLLSNGNEQPTEDKKKTYFKYTNRRNFGSDTAAIFWTRENRRIDAIDFLDEPDPGQIANLYDSVFSGDKKKSRLKNTDRFYSCTLSGAAARIAVRDWIERSLDDIHSSIADWFKDIEIGVYDSNHRKIMPHYTGIFDLARASQRMVSKNKYDDHDTTLSRVATLLWRAALDKKPIPVSALTAVLKRIRVDDRGVSPERAALIKLILNRNSNGGEMMKSSVDDKNDNVAYVCGRMFCVIENIQRAALGKTNAGVRERYFASASTTPSSAFGRLLKMSQNHLTKLKGDKPGLVVIFDKELQELFVKVNDFPATFRLEDQGRFALGYYHQKHETFRKLAENKDMKEALSEEENNSKGDKQ